MQISSDICKTINLFIGGAIVCYLANLSVKNNIETTFKYGEASLTLKNSDQFIENKAEYSVSTLHK